MTEMTHGESSATPENMGFGFGRYISQTEMENAIKSGVSGEDLTRWTESRKQRYEANSPRWAADFPAQSLELGGILQRANQYDREHAPITADIVDDSTPETPLFVEEDPTQPDIFGQANSKKLHDELMKHPRYTAPTMKGIDNLLQELGVARRPEEDDTEVFHIPAIVLGSEEAKPVEKLEKNSADEADMATYRIKNRIKYAEASARGIDGDQNLMLTHVTRVIDNLNKELDEGSVDVRTRLHDNATIKSLSRAIIYENSKDAALFSVVSELDEASRDTNLFETDRKIFGYCYDELNDIFSQPGIQNRFREATQALIAASQFNEEDMRDEQLLEAVKRCLNEAKDYIHQAQSDKLQRQAAVNTAFETVIEKLESLKI